MGDIPPPTQPPTLPSGPGDKWSWVLLLMLSTGVLEVWAWYSYQCPVPKIWCRCWRKHVSGDADTTWSPSKGQLLSLGEIQLGSTSSRIFAGPWRMWSHSPIPQCLEFKKVVGWAVACSPSVGSKTANRSYWSPRNFANEPFGPRRMDKAIDGGNQWLSTSVWWKKSVQSLIGRNKGPKYTWRPLKQAHTEPAIHRDTV